jgi:nucleoid DNA-binding protein
MAAFSRLDLARQIAAEGDVTQETANNVTGRVLEAIAGVLAHDGEVTLTGIGTLRVRPVKVGDGFRRRPTFSLSPTLKDRIKLPGKASVPAGARVRNSRGRFEGKALQKVSETSGGGKPAATSRVFYGRPVTDRPD